MTTSLDLPGEIDCNGRVADQTPRPLSALIHSADPGWPLLQAWFSEATNRVDVVPADRRRAERTLVALQVTTRSPLGAMALETGGVLVDRGWVRLLGGGAPGIEGDLARWNGLIEDPIQPIQPGLLLVGYDVLGGFFAVNGGALGETRGNVFYFAPDSLAWEDLGRGYGDFLHFLCVGDLGRFYEGFRWPTWEADIATLSFDQGITIYPPLWTAEGRVLETQHRAPAPARELLEWHREMVRQLAGVANGTHVRLDPSSK